jgi:hypothetical protein
MLSLSLIDLLIVSFLAPLGAVIEFYLLYRLIIASLGRKIKRNLKQLVLG